MNLECELGTYSLLACPLPVLFQTVSTGLCFVCVRFYHVVASPGRNDPGGRSRRTDPCVDWRTVKCNARFVSGNHLGSPPSQVRATPKEISSRPGRTKGEHRSNRVRLVGDRCPGLRSGHPGHPGPAGCLRALRRDLGHHLPRHRGRGVADGRLHPGDRGDAHGGLQWCSGGLEEWSSGGVLGAMDREAEVVLRGW